jgi:hypothetical protein
MKTPRAAATAGILFSLLLITSMLLIRSSIPANPLGAATEVIENSGTISLALNLMPFAGIAFLWFIAVMRDRLGELEDHFFATVFLGSGLLFIAMIFTAAAIAGGDCQSFAEWIGNPRSIGCLHTWSHPSLSSNEHLRDENGCGVYDLNV